MSGERSGETSAQMRERGNAARQRQQQWIAARPKITCNARMGPKELGKYCSGVIILRLREGASQFLAWMLEAVWGKRRCQRSLRPKVSKHIKA